MQLGEQRLASVWLGLIVLAVAITLPFAYRVVAYEYLGTAVSGVFVVVRDEGDTAGYYAPDPHAEGELLVFKKRVTWLPGRLHFVTRTEQHTDPLWLYVPDSEPVILENPFHGLSPLN